jgi:hypothetical protein
MTHLRPQHVCVHVWMSERQCQKHLRPVVVGSMPAQTTTCGPTSVGRDRHHTYTSGVMCYDQCVYSQTRLPSYVSCQKSTCGHSPVCCPQCSRRTLDSTALYLNPTELRSISMSSGTSPMITKHGGGGRSGTGKRHATPHRKPLSESDMGGRLSFSLLFSFPTY